MDILLNGWGTVEVRKKNKFEIIDNRAYMQAGAE
jgi:hypothetical protein